MKKLAYRQYVIVSLLCFMLLSSSTVFAQFTQEEPLSENGTVNHVGKAFLNQAERNGSEWADEDVSPPPRSVEASAYAATAVASRAYDHDTDTYHFLQENPDSNDFAQYSIQHRNDPNDLDQWQRQVDNQGSGPNQSVSTLLIDSWDDIPSSEIDYLEAGIIHYDTDAQRTFSFDEISVGSEAALGMAVMNDGYEFTWAGIEIANRADLNEGSCP